MKLCLLEEQQRCITDELLELMVDVMIECNKEGMIVDVSANTMRYLNMSKDDILKHKLSFLDCIAPTDKLKARNFLKIVQEHNMCHNWELHLQPNTERPPLLINFSAARHNIAGFNENILLIGKVVDERLTRLQQKIATYQRELSARTPSLSDIQANFKQDSVSHKTPIYEQLQLARVVQESFLPKDIPIPRHCDIEALYYPASGIGGDLYDVIPIDEYKVGIFIADVSGHGLAAALMTGVVKNMLRNLRHSFSSPDMLMTELNEEITEFFRLSELDSLVTAVYAVVDAQKGTVTITNAGHPAPLAIDRSKNNIVTLNGGGELPLGIFPRQTYLATECGFSEGKRLYFVTDGLYELNVNKDGGLLGYEGLTKLLFEHRIYSGLESVMALRALISEASVKDDVSCVLVERHM